MLGCDSRIYIVGQMNHSTESRYVCHYLFVGRFFLVSTNKHIVLKTSVYLSSRLQRSLGINECDLKYSQSSISSTSNCPVLLCYTSNGFISFFLSLSSNFSHPNTVSHLQTFLFQGFRCAVKPYCMWDHNALQKIGQALSLCFLHMCII